jgi:hypothetical protein
MAHNNNLLLDEYPLMVLPSLAKAIGLNEALMLQQVHYWLLNNKRNKKQDYCIDGKWWVKASYTKWQRDNFPFWSAKTIQRIVTSLQKQGLLQWLQPNKATGDMAKWYTIDYTHLDKLSIPSGQDVLMDEDKLSIPIGTDSPNLLEETNKETKETISASADAGSVDASKKPMSMYDAIKEVWEYEEGRNGDMQKMLQGNATKKGFKEYNVKPAVTPDELIAWRNWYKRNNPNLSLVEDHGKVQNSILKYRRAQEKKVIQMPASTGDFVSPGLEPLITIPEASNDA